jgi:hypothetical protein
MPAICSVIEEEKNNMHTDLPVAPGTARMCVFHHGEADSSCS